MHHNLSKAAWPGVAVRNKAGLPVERPGAPEEGGR